MHGELYSDLVIADMKSIVLTEQTGVVSTQMKQNSVFHTVTEGSGTVHPGQVYFRV